MIGNDTTARTLYTYFDGDPYSRSGFKRAPRGFHRIGDGAFRTAYLSLSEKVVYKIGDSDTNLIEYNNSLQLLSKPIPAHLGFELIIPQTRLVPMPEQTYTSGGREVKYEPNVSIQEYAKGKPTWCSETYTWMPTYKGCTCKRKLCFAVILDRIMEWSGLEDVHEYNVLVDQNDRFWLIDMGG